MAQYKLYNARGEEVTPGDLQNKALWCQHGMSLEESFVAEHGASLGIGINEAKGYDQYAPDLIHYQSGRLGDLKTQNRPFFKARQLHGLDPQTAIVFNRKDAERYRACYPDIDIYFWVDWVATRFEGRGESIEIKPMTGVWQIPFATLEQLLAAAPEHSYQQRRYDTRGNAKSSFVLDLSSPAFTRLI